MKFFFGEEGASSTSKFCILWRNEYPKLQFSWKSRIPALGTMWQSQRNPMVAPPVILHSTSVHIVAWHWILMSMHVDVQLLVAENSFTLIWNMPPETLCFIFWGYDIANLRPIGDWCFSFYFTRRKGRGASRVSEVKPRWSSQLLSCGRCWARSSREIRSLPWPCWS